LLHTKGFRLEQARLRFFGMIELIIVRKMRECGRISPCPKTPT
jgi:hypothetical protein